MSQPARQLTFHRVHAVLMLSALLGAGCAARAVQGQWTDPQFANHSLRGAKVLVVCDSNEAAVKRICEEQMSAQLAAVGATPVIMAGEAPASGSSNERALAAARAAGAKAVLLSTVAPEVTAISPGPSIGVGIGGFGGFGGSRSGGISTGVGVSVPVGKERVDTAYAANITLTNVDSGHLMWTGKVTASGSQDINQQLASLARNGIEAAQRAALF
jgi:hypothetical protein